MRSTFYYKNNRKQGFGLIEIIIGSAILSLVMLATSFFYQQALKVSNANVSEVTADFLVEQGLEAARIWRDESWMNISGLTAGTDYYLVWTNGNWATTTTNAFIDGSFEQKITAENVSRGASDKIVESGGTVDSNIRKITSTVSWWNSSTQATTSISAATYLANIF